MVLAATRDRTGPRSIHRKLRGHAMNIDHIVLWVSDQKRSLDFFVNVVGLDPVRAQEFAEGGAGLRRRCRCLSGSHAAAARSDPRRGGGAQS